MSNGTIIILTVRKSFHYNGMCAVCHDLDPNQRLGDPRGWMVRWNANTVV
jgi:hypothetical protein